MPSDRPSLAASLRKQTPEEMKEAFLRGEPVLEAPTAAAPALESEPVRGRKPSEPRLHATFKMKARNHRRLKKLSGLIERDMVDILEEALEPHLEQLIDQHGLRDTFVKLEC
jgi:hypothetical protein